MVFVAVIGGLLAAIPLSAMASENILAGDVRQAQVSLSEQLNAAVRGGLEPVNADTLMWQYSQIQAIRPSSWWQTPIAEHNKLDKLGQLSHELNALYQEQIRESQDALQRQFHRW